MLRSAGHTAAAVCRGFNASGPSGATDDAAIHGSSIKISLLTDLSSRASARPRALRKQTQQEFQHCEPRIAELTQQIDAIDAEDLVKAQAHRERQQRHARALELARLRVLDFIGAPDVQMQLAGRLWGHCCICGKELIDPISLERGIGPECLGRRIDGIRRLAAENRRPETIAAIVGMPLAFVHEVLGELKMENPQ